MAKARNAKYVAEGFHEDSGKLLKEFEDKKSVEFKVFAEIWRNHYFSLIFMGRPDDVELTEFTNEIFRISTQYLAAESFYRKVGAVYLLYGLFRTQISTPCIKIRIERSHWEIIKSLVMDAVENKYGSLHYCIDFLREHAFIFVAHQMLKGPTISIVSEPSKYEEAITNLKATYKSDFIEYSHSNNLQKIRDLHLVYEEEKKKAGIEDKVGLNAASKSYEKFMQELKTIVNPSTKQLETVGSRRALLKAQSFQRKTLDRFGRATDNDKAEGGEVEQEEGIEPSVRKTKVIRKKRAQIRQQDRRAGRPPKEKEHKSAELVLDDDSDDSGTEDISHLLLQQQEFYLPPENPEGKTPRTRREPYYKLSPKRQEEDSSD